MIKKIKYQICSLFQKARIKAGKKLEPYGTIKYVCADGYCWYDEIEYRAVFDILRYRAPEFFEESPLLQKIELKWYWKNDKLKDENIKYENRKK
jgi:hypothetical protein